MFDNASLEHGREDPRYRVVQSTHRKLMVFDGPEHETGVIGLDQVKSEIKGRDGIHSGCPRAGERINPVNPQLLSAA